MNCALCKGVGNMDIRLNAELDLRLGLGWQCQSGIRGNRSTRPPPHGEAHRHLGVAEAELMAASNHGTPADADYAPVA